MDAWQHICISIAGINESNDVCEHIRMCKFLRPHTLGIREEIIHQKAGAHPKYQRTHTAIVIFQMIPLHKKEQEYNDNIEKPQ